MLLFRHKGIAMMKEIVLLLIVLQSATKMTAKYLLVDLKDTKELMISASDYEYSKPQGMS